MAELDADESVTSQNVSRQETSPTDQLAELSPRAAEVLSVSQYLIASESSKSRLAAKSPSQSERPKTPIAVPIEQPAASISPDALRVKSGTWAKIDPPTEQDTGRPQDSQTTEQLISNRGPETCPETPNASTKSPVSSPRTVSSSKAPRKKTARELWKRAIVVAHQVSVLGRFRTLRDYTALEISREQLKEGIRIGEGAFAIVERYSLMPSRRNVAVKRLKPHVVSKSGGEEMLAEIALLRKLRHRNIVEFVGFGSWDMSSPQAELNSVFMVEEFVDGGTLKSVVSRQMKSAKDLYTIQDACRWLTQIASGLAYLHQCQPMVIHRDLKLENILLQGTVASTQHAKIADFGLSALVNMFSPDELDGPARSRPSYSLAEGWTRNARNKMRSFAGNDLLQNVPGVRDEIAEPEEEVTKRQLVKRESKVSQSVTSALRVADAKGKLTGRLGTLMYMAPEVYLRRPYNDKADVYSFAIIAYELLHRYQMISATDGSLEECMAYAHRAAHSGFRPPLDESLPKSLKQLITRCWAANPDARPTMEEAMGFLVTMLKSYSFDRHEIKRLRARDEEELGGCCCCG